MRYFEALVMRWRRLSPTVRWLLGAFVGAAFCLATFAGILAHAPRSSLFATPLHPEQLREVEDRLASWNVPFTPSADNVVVARNLRSSLLLKLSLAGVPHPHLATSGETLATLGVLTPQAVIDAQARNGLANDIARSLRGIVGIDDARVIIAPARAMEFADQRAQDASASVRLRMHPGARLTAAAISGIRSFVAASVAGLRPKNVTLMDDRGVALNANSEDGDAAGLQAALQSALDAAFGVGTSIVRVRVETDPLSIERHVVRRSAIGGPPIAANDSAETYVSGAKHYSKHALQDDRGSDLQDTLSSGEPGRLRRISSAVFIDRSRAVDLASVRALAAATIGFNPHRGDQLVVQAVDFHHAPTPLRDGWWLLYGAIVPLLPALALAVGAVVVARIVARPLVRACAAAFERASLSRRSQSVVGYTPARVHGALVDEPPHAAAAIISALPAATAAAVLELYPQHERDAIVRRMQRPHSHLVPDTDELLARHA